MGLLRRNGSVLLGASSAVCATWALGLPCPFRRLTGLDCPACGATRAVMSLVSGRPLDAADHNLAFVTALAALALVMIAPLFGLDSRRIQAWAVSPSRRLFWLGLIVGWTVLRNLPHLAWLRSGSA